MKVRRLVATLLGGRLQIVLIVFSSLVAALTVASNTVVIARVAQDYLADAEAGVAINLAQAFYQLKQDEIAVISYRLVLDPAVIQNLPLARQGRPEAIRIIDQQITNKITGTALEGTHLIAVLDAQGNVLVGRAVSLEGDLSPTISVGDWSSLPIVKTVLSSGVEHAATEIIPVDMLAQVGLDRQAQIALIQTAL